MNINFGKNYEFQHINFVGQSEYIAALDLLCGLAKHSLCVFEHDFVNIGFNNDSRYSLLRNFLLRNPNNQLQLLAHNTGPLSQYNPRIITLFRQFGHNMHIYQTSKPLHRVTDPFAIADLSNFVRRFHFNDARGILGLNDGACSRQLQSRFNEMWEASAPSSSTAIFTL